jgi:hypothetical protein
MNTFFDVNNNKVFDPLHKLVLQHIPDVEHKSVI